MAELRILITGGGTGGHLFPALAIGEEIKNRMDQERGGKPKEEYVDNSGRIKDFGSDGLAKDAQGRTVYHPRGEYDLNRKPVKYF